MSYTDLMIDIETMGVESSAPVLSIGVVAFNLHNPDLPVKTLYVELDWGEQIDSGLRKVDSSTLKFWLSQSKEAQNSLFKKTPVSASAALGELADFCRTHLSEGFHAWGNGPHFDITIMDSLHTSYKLRSPWKYNKVNDLRTLQRLAGKSKVPRVGTYHNALDDAMYQVNVAHDCVARLGIKGVNRE